jgi:hypothetical protein
MELGITVSCAGGSGGGQIVESVALLPDELVKVSDGFAHC